MLGRPLPPDGYGSRRQRKQSCPASSLHNGMQGAVHSPVTYAAEFRLLPGQPLLLIPNVEASCGDS